MEELQSWWQVPTIAHFCSLFRAAFNLLDFDIEELEEALICENNEDVESSFLEELVVRLIGGCYQRSNLNLDNYQKFLLDFVKHRCGDELTTVLNEKKSFLGLSIRQKVDLLHALCDARLDAHDVAEVLKNLEADSLRVEPLGEDSEGRTYWYFYGTRLYREEKQRKILHAKRRKEKKRKKGKTKKEEEANGDKEDKETPQKPKWSIACSTEDEWRLLAEGFKKSKSRCEKELYQTLTVHFLPEISRMIMEREKMVKKKLTELAPRRSSRRIECLKKQKEEEKKILATVDDHKREEKDIEAKKERARESRLREERVLDRHMAREDRARRARMRDERAQRLETEESFDPEANFIQSGLIKVFDILRSHPDAWPFVEPVDEKYAPGYYSVIQRPMALSTIDQKLRSREYSQPSQFEADVTLMVDNCRKFNGLDSDYTKMAERLGRAYERAVQRYFNTPITDTDDDNDDSEDMDIDVVENGVDKSQMSTLNRPRRQASMKAMQMLTQVAEEVLKDSKKSKKKRPALADLDFTSSTSSSAASSDEDFGKVSFANKMTETRREKINQSAQVVKKLVVQLPEEKRASILNFTALYKASLTNNVSPQTSTTNMAVVTSSMPTMASNTPMTKFVVVPVKKRPPFLVQGEVKKCRTDVTSGGMTSFSQTTPHRTVISLLKKPETTSVANVVTVNSGTATAQLSTGGIVQQVSTAAAPAQIQFVTSTGIRLAGLPSNLVPLTLRTTQMQTQPQMFVIHQQGGQVILEQQLVAPTFQVNASQVATQFIPATTTHKTLVALAPSPLPTPTTTTNGLAQY